MRRPGSGHHSGDCRVTSGDVTGGFVVVVWSQRAEPPAASHVRSALPDSHSSDFAWDGTEPKNDSSKKK